MRSGEITTFKRESKKRDYKIVEIVFLLAQFAKQLRVLSSSYCTQMEPFFEVQAYSPRDPNGFNYTTFQEYRAAVSQMVLVYDQVEITV